MVVKPNLYASLDIISEIGMNKSKPQSNGTQNGLLHHQISPKRCRMVKNDKKLLKVGKNFQKISINSKRLKNSISFEIFTHFSTKLQTRILGALSGKIRHPLLGNSSCPPLPNSCKFLQFPWSILFSRPI